MLPRANELCDRAVEFHAGDEAVLYCLRLVLLINFHAQATTNQRIARMEASKLSQYGNFRSSMKLLSDE